MPKTTEQYNAELARHLRLRGLDEAQISEAARMVESFVADSGGTAEEAFGPSSRYARTFTPSAGSAGRGRGGYVVAWLLATLAAALLLVSWSARGQEQVLGLFTPTVGIAVGSALLLLWAFVLGLRLTSGPRRHDPSGRRA